MYHVPHEPHVPECVFFSFHVFYGASHLILFLSFTTLCLMALPIRNANFVLFFLCLRSTDTVVLIYAVQISVLVDVVVNMP